jgi:phospholipid-binding lipoprotein MlaA
MTRVRGVAVISAIAVACLAGAAGAEQTVVLWHLSDAGTSLETSADQAVPSRARETSVRPFDGERDLQGVRVTEAAADAEPSPPAEMTLRTEREFVEEYDPWEPYNEVMFDFNYQVFDRYLLKPAATAWDKVVPDQFQRALGNAFDNLAMPRRVVNSLLQLKLKGVGHELIRFILNTTIGVAGLFDIATQAGIEKSNEDTGQTLGVYGVGPGPYLILPILNPLTVRDAFGLAVDAALDPLNYFIPVAAAVGRRAGDTVNDRSLNLELFQSVEETTVDLYGAVRNAYLQRRQFEIER